MTDAEYSRRFHVIRAATSRLALGGPASSYQQSYTLPFQRWYKFKEAYSPQLLLDFLATLDRPHHICDPFGGSGTTALVSQYLGVQCSTIEVNPFLCDVIRAKLATYDVRRLDLAFMRVLKAKGSVSSSLSALEKYAPKTLVEPGLHGRFVFSRAVMIRILRIRDAIARESDVDVRCLFSVLLAAILVPVSNVVVNGKGRRYRRNWEEAMATTSDVQRLFSEQYEDVRSDLRLQTLKTSVRPRVIEGDARVAVESIEQDVDLAVFSPPYPNSFDYTDIYNIELWVMGYFADASANRSLRLRTMQSHVQICHPRRYPVAQSRRLIKTVEMITNRAESLWNRRIPHMVSGYFADLEAVIKALGKRMNRGGTIACVVGDSLYAGVPIDVPAIMSELFADADIKFVASTTLRTMKASAQHDWTETLKESLITLRVSNGRR